IALAFGDVVRVVDDDAVAAFSGGGPADAGCESAAGLVVLESRLLVLVAGQLEAIAPPLLEPRALNQPPALERIADRQRSRVAGKQPSPARGRDPFPHGPEDADRKRLHVPGRDIDEQVADLAIRYCFQMVGDDLDVLTIH